jgi:hypothetical protein
MNSHLRVLVRKQRNEKYNFSLNLELVLKAGDYDFPQPRDGPRNCHLFFKWPLIDIEFDMPGLRDIHMKVV